MDDYKFLVQAFEKINSIGRHFAGGIDRLGYSNAESEVHKVLCDIAAQMGLAFKTDEVGNTFINPFEKDFYIIGSHLDSVPDGGGFDGVSGILAGLLLLKWNKEADLDLPVSVGAFRCEESSRFGRATIGSSLCTGNITREELCTLRDKNGISISDAIERSGFKSHPYSISGLKGYIELHIEQGRVLESKGEMLGVVTSIAAPTRFQLKIFGRQDHSGATPMYLRKDSLCAASEVISLVESLGENQSEYSTVTTVGCINNEPNVMNVVPGFTELFIDIRGINKESINYVVGALKEGVTSILNKRKIDCNLTQICSEDPVDLDKDVIKGLEYAAVKENISYEKMPSGAGHDAMEFARITSTGMLFIASKGGISHNREEFSDINDIISGTKVILRYFLKNK